MKTNNLRLAVLGACSSYLAAAMAIEPAAVSAGPMVIVPMLEVQLGHNDNLTTVNTGEIDSLFTVTKPSVTLVAEKENDAYRFTYIAEDGVYHDSAKDNYTDHTLIGEAILELNSRNHLNLSATYAKDHEDRGSTDAAFGDQVTQFTDRRLDGTYRFGAENATINVEVSAFVLDHSYKNLEATNLSRDRENDGYSGTVFYRISPRTQLLAEARYEDIEYDLSTSTLDSDETRYLAGMTWEATAKTSGTVKVGYIEKEFDSSARKDQDGTTWEVGVQWAPKTYSVFELTSSQRYEEADAADDGRDVESVSLAWNHSWSDRLSSEASVSMSERDYLGTGVSRSDDLDEYRIGLNYEARRWLSLNLGYTYSDNDSNIAVQDWDRNLVLLTVLMSL
jgi:polysaccharide biosynthesis protein VpsM